MLAAILEVLLQMLAEVLLQLFAEALFELGFVSLAHSIRRGRFANPILAGIGLCVVGAAVGFVTCWILPNPLGRPARLLPGLSLVFAPLATGAAMHAYGSWQRGRGGDPTLLATLWGGAIFAFAMGLARAACIART